MVRYTYKVLGVWRIEESLQEVERNKHSEFVNNQSCKTAPVLPWMAPALFFSRHYTWISYTLFECKH